MIVNKKFDRLRQWGKEKMGAEIRSAPNEVFKALEMEMNLRHEGLEKMYGSMSAYVKSLGKVAESESKEKTSTIAALGSAMARHGGDFDQSSKFGECLLNFGHANEKIARTQDAYVGQATSGWLNTLEKSLAQMRDYQNARKKMDSRRLAYDTSLGKIQKAKKDDYRAEEDLRLQKAKFEESSDDVYRRMQDIVESDEDNMAELYAFLEAELSYHDRCRETLLRLKNNWPAGNDSSKGNCLDSPGSPKNALARLPSNLSTVSRQDGDDEMHSLCRPPSSFRKPSRISSANTSPQRELSNPLRTTTSDIPLYRAQTPLSAVPTHELPRIRPVRSSRSYYSHPSENVFGDDDEDSSSSPEAVTFWEGEFATRSSSPATTASYGTSCEGPRSRGSSLSAADVVRGATWVNNVNRGFTNGTCMTSVSGTVKKAPPPPPPSRATKPRLPPPPPPMKRSALSFSSGTPAA